MWCHKCILTHIGVEKIKGASCAKKDTLHSDLEVIKMEGFSCDGYDDLAQGSLRSISLFSDGDLSQDSGVTEKTFLISVGALLNFIHTGGCHRRFASGISRG